MHTQPVTKKKNSKVFIPPSKGNKIYSDEFTCEEDLVLTQNYIKHARMLRDPHMSRLHKKKVWEKITAAVDAQGPIHRPLERVRKRMDNIKAGRKTSLLFMWT